MKVSDIVNSTGHSLANAIADGQYRLLDACNGDKDLRIDAIISLHEIQKKVNREMYNIMRRIDRIE